MLRLSSCAKVSFCQSIMFPKYQFAKVSFDQSSILRKYQVAKISCCQNTIASLLASQDHPVWVPRIHFSRTMVPLEPSPPVYKWAKRQLEPVDLQKDPKRYIKICPTLQRTMVPVEPSPRAKSDICKMFGQLYYQQPSHGTTIPLGPSPLEIVRNAWLRNDPDCHFANFSVYHFSTEWGKLIQAKLNTLIFWHRRNLAK